MRGRTVEMHESSLGTCRCCRKGFVGARLPLQSHVLSCLRKFPGERSRRLVAIAQHSVGVRLPQSSCYNNGYMTVRLSVVALFTRSTYQSVSASGTACRGNTTRGPGRPCRHDPMMHSVLNDGAVDDVEP